MTTTQKIKKIEKYRDLALQYRRDLHDRRHDPLFRKDYIDYGKVIDEANSAIGELHD